MERSKKLGITAMMHTHHKFSLLEPSNGHCGDSRFIFCRDVSTSIQSLNLQLKCDVLCPLSFSVAGLVRVVQEAKLGTTFFRVHFLPKYASVFFSFIPIILSRKNASSSLIVLDCGVWPSFEPDDCLQAAW